MLIPSVSKNWWPARWSKCNSKEDRIRASWSQDTLIVGYVWEFKTEGWAYTQQKRGCTIWDDRNKAIIYFVISIWMSRISFWIFWFDVASWKPFKLTLKTRQLWCLHSDRIVPCGSFCLRTAASLTLTFKHASGREIETRIYLSSVPGPLGKEMQGSKLSDRRWQCISMYFMHERSVFIY